MGRPSFLADPVMIPIRVNRETRDRWQAEAQARKLSVAQVVRFAVEEYFRRHKPYGRNDFDRG